MQFHENNFFDLFVFTSFFAWTFLNFLTHCITVRFQVSTRIRFVRSFSSYIRNEKFLIRNLGGTWCLPVKIRPRGTSCSKLRLLRSSQPRSLSKILKRGLAIVAQVDRNECFGEYSSKSQIPPWESGKENLHKNRI